MQETSSSSDPESGDESTPKRVVQLIVSIVVMTGVTVVVGYGGGFLLTIIAALGGPDPQTEDGEPLRERLLTWPDRNREFMRTNGKSEFPWPP